MRKIAAILFLLYVSGTHKVIAQTNIVFQHLNTANGLSYIGINDMCSDKKGNLWISTGNGLNMFNGKTVEKYFSSEYPQLQNSNVIHVTCDSSNRIWVLTAGGNVTVLDEKRQFHRVGLYENNEFARARWILNSQQGGIILFTIKGFYAFNPTTPIDQQDSLTTKNFRFLPVKDFDTLLKKFFRQILYYDDDSYLFVRDEAIFKVNFRTKKIEKKLPFLSRTALIKWGENQLLVHNLVTNEAEILDLASQEITYPFRGLKDQYGKKITATFSFAQKIKAQEYLLTTTTSGIFIYNQKTNKISNYFHNIVDPYSISADNTTTIGVGPKGWIFITCIPNGISYFNCNDFVGNKNVFVDYKGNGYDGYIAGIATRDNNIYYVGTTEGLVKWNRSTNSTSFLDYYDKDGSSLFTKQEITFILIDNKERVWATTSKRGILVIDKNDRLIRHIENFSKDQSGIKIRNITCLKLGPDDYIWASGGNGVCRIDPNTFKTDNFENTPLARFDSFLCYSLLFTDKNNLWIASLNNGVFHYNLTTKVTRVFNTANGLLSNNIFCINADSSKNIYIGSRMGLNILFTNGRMKTISQKEGLLIDRAEGLLLDKHNRMWIGNDIGLACYNPKDSSLVVFDERYGLTVYGFRVNSYFLTPNGEFVLGTPRGMQYFQPDSLFNRKITLNGLISKIETKYIVSSITDNAVFKLSPTDNQVTFHFSSIDFSPHARTYYRYQLIGIDNDWIQVMDQNSVRYNSLPPGEFLFKVMISNDNRNWQKAENDVHIIIAAPFYRTWWVKSMGILLGLVIIWFVLRYFRMKHIRQMEELETQTVISYFASRINSYQKIEDVLWDVAKNCISKLHFEDCVIYLVDEERNVLVQKAAHGPKQARDYTIHGPIEIPVGRGIVGSVAATGRPELIGNTDLDERYITDDVKRYSEVAVPLVVDDKVIGVIDSEHSKKNFFNQKHLSILSTIAVLCANQIQRAKAEEEKQKAKIEALEDKQKVAETRLQSLRLQMNPHFLFNALNSIQQMILANEELVATRFLSRFSKLLRTILIHSDKEKVTLKEELEILNLYIELEARRFKDSFQYTIQCDEEIDEDEIKLPTLLIQPFVENAIWHGLMHKEGDRKLSIRFSETDNFLQCIIQDNGIGRRKSQETKRANGQDKGHVSKGIQVSMERLKTIHNKNGYQGSLNIVDLFDENGVSAGTRVEINFPVQN